MSSTRNKTITMSEQELVKYSSRVSLLPSVGSTPVNSGYAEDVNLFLSHLDNESIDLCIADPPYNLDKKFGKNKFKKINHDAYYDFLYEWMLGLYPKISANGVAYVCGDWTSSIIIPLAAKDVGFNINNRITWERDKGRGSASNWKNCIEDIWMLTKAEDYVFNADAVKIKRKVIAPYKNPIGDKKDWNQDSTGNYRFTSASNLWTDITIPFWSMAENTSHPTQKPEKLIAKLILSTSNEKDTILDLFSGSGTTSVVAKKLNRNYIYCDSDIFWCAMTEKRLEIADIEKRIQGFEDGVFYHRNML